MTGNAPFNNARGTASSQQLAPPFAFKDVTMSVFPLRANLARLESFCDAYLNHAGDAIKFQPFLPYVYLIILDYGRMSVEAANMGWISQHEVAFSVPLRWMQKESEGGILDFRDWAFTSPFIFVDNELSMSTGREVYGWPKTLVHLDPTISEWVQDPPGSRRVFHVSVKAVSRAYEGEHFERQPFLNVYHRPATNVLTYPPDLLGLFRPIAQLPNTGLNAARLAVDLAKAMGGIATQGITGSPAFPDLFDKERVRSLLKSDKLLAWLNPAAWQPGLCDLLWSLFPMLAANTINLKQFRDAGSTEDACYQAITNARMEVEAINRAGPLGQQNLLLGQLDGGYSIDIHRNANWSIINALGLEIAETRRDGETDVATLAPVFPFWMQVDMTYARGEVLTWRSGATGWNWQVSSQAAKDRVDVIDFAVKGRDLTDKAETVADVSAMDRAEPDVQTVVGFRPKTMPTDSLYNTARGAGEELSGPFLSPNTTIRVLPLLADQAVLDRFVGSYLNVRGHARYRAWGHHVYLVISTYPGRSSASRNVGLIAHREISFAVPIKCYEWFDDGDPAYDAGTVKGRAALDRDKLTGTALVTPFSYVDDVSVAITASEVEGVPTLRSAITSPPARWMDTDGPDGTAGALLMESSALVLPTLGVGAGASTERLISVSSAPLLSDQDEAGWRRIAGAWGRHVRRDLLRKFRQRGRRSAVESGKGDRAEAFGQVRALALQLLAGKLPIVSLALKQFRDSWHTDTACYQSLVQGERRIEALHELQEIEQALHVSITRFPTQPIAKVLGLIAKDTRVTGDGIVDMFEALRPFWLRADLKLDLGSTLFERVADPKKSEGPKPWVRLQQPERSFGWQATTPEELAAMKADQTVRKKTEAPPDEHFRILCERSAGDGWTRSEETVKDADFGRFQPRQADGTRCRNLMVWRRQRKHTQMADPERLNTLDREHVRDLAAFLDSSTAVPAEAPSTAELAVSVGATDPATVLDSILSRQWACPEERRHDHGKADFGVNVESFGPNLQPDLFPESERQDRFWPQGPDPDQKPSHVIMRLGRRLQRLVRAAPAQQ
ncbi:MAG: hypothetical protein R3F54_06915 [Alphaproteobacteria bacterium]